MPIIMLFMLFPINDSHNRGDDRYYKFGKSWDGIGKSKNFLDFKRVKSAARNILYIMKINELKRHMRNDMNNTNANPKGREIPDYSKEEIESYRNSLRFESHSNSGMKKFDKDAAKKLVHDAQSEIEKDFL